MERDHLLKNKKNGKKEKQNGKKETEENTYKSGIYCFILSKCILFVSADMGGCPRGVMVKAMDCGIVVREFVLQSRYYVHISGMKV